MIKLHGFGGPTEFWDYALESFTLMAGLAAVTERIRLYASCSVRCWRSLPLNAVRMAVTIDLDQPRPLRAQHRLRAWQKAEYDQMSIWPGEPHFFCAATTIARKYADGVHVKELWATGQSDFKGQFFTRNDCRLLPKPTAKIDIICAGQSAGGEWVSPPLMRDLAIPASAWGFGTSRPSASPRCSAPS